MHDLFKSQPTVKLNEIVIPGTHDSATDEMTKHSPYATFNKLHRVNQQLVCLWAKTQHHTIYDQLMDGVRYLDLRIENHADGWKTFHGLLSNNLTDVLDQIGVFATNHNREIILVDLQNLVNFDFQDHVNLTEYIIKHPSIGLRMAGNHFGADGTLLDFWNADKNIIFFYTEGYRHFSHLYWLRHTSIENPWYNTPKKSVLQEKLLSGICKRKPGYFHVSQLVLTPDAFKVVTGLLTKVSSLYSLTIPGITDLISSEFLQSLELKATQANTHLNIVIVDFYEHSSFIENCLKINADMVVSRNGLA
ncbi:hypothetical protein EB796_003513 [Bugula neritina]|uniref:Phosphatidylinositol-specific phospholipase C X domain-containing protein n=1 Tax=Bugula neritina TaxID=10212 RepID=A0A7J7KHN7_BUGNE|nr:hypothetical protein EB796_003513 [Bugula neritina]